MAEITAQQKAAMDFIYQQAVTDLLGLGWLDPTAAEALRTELSNTRTELAKLINLREAAKAWRAVWYPDDRDESGWALMLAVDALSTPPPGGEGGIELCRAYDGAADHPYGVCQLPAGHDGRHVERRNGELWAEWSGPRNGPPPGEGE